MHISKLIWNMSLPIIASMLVQALYNLSLIHIFGKFIDQILPEDNLPQTLTSYSPCFRKEKGAHGIEERGVYRIHQFEKQEMIDGLYALCCQLQQVAVRRNSQNVRFRG